MGKYTGIKSKFIREKIKKVSWKNKDKLGKIDDLIFIEKFILGKIGGIGAGYRWKDLEETKEAKIIFKELDPKGFAKEHKLKKQEIAREKKEEARQKKEERLAEEGDKKDWIKAGGKA